MALTPQQQTALLQMTQAMFNAAPGSVYLSALGSQIEAGQSIAGLAQSLSGTAMFLGKDYSTLTVPAEFAAALVDDLVGDGASAAKKTVAINFIVDRMNAGANQDAIITEVTGILSTMPVSNPTWGKAALHFNTGNVGILVNNLLGKAVDADTKAAAVDLLLDRMASGDSFGTVVEWAYTTLDSVDHANPVWGTAATLFDNRIEVSDYYTLQKHGAATDVTTLRQVLSGVTADSASVLTAKQAIDALLGGNLPSIDLASLNGSNGLVMSNDVLFTNGTNAGIASVNGAGDLNGDGYDDVIIGVGGFNDQSQQVGAGFVMFGKASGFAATQPLSGLDGSNGFRLNGLPTGDAAGNAVSRAGDINGDGIGDLLIGAPAVGSDGNYTGSTYVVFGNTAGFSASMELPALDGSNGFRLTGPQSTGSSVNYAGDVNGDGYGDVIVGAPFANAEYPNNGSGFVVFGKASGFQPTLDVSALDGSNGFRLDGIEFADSLGNKVSSGDFNGDGLSDLMFGSTLSGKNGVADPNTGQYSYTGSVYVVFGSNGGFPAQFDTNALNGSNGFRINGAGNDQAGTFMSSLGDINGDKIDDMIIGTYAQSNSAYVVFGKNAGFAATLDLHALDGSQGFRISGTAVDGLGDVSNAGDFNGDGIDDFIVDTSGNSILVFGKSTGFGATLALDKLDADSGVILRNASVGDVEAAGDINKDGFDDLILGGADQALVVFGSAEIVGVNAATQVL